MTTWSYEARTRTGELRKGSVDAPNQDAALAKVRGMQLTPIRVKKSVRLADISFGSPVTIKDLVIFTRQFATMIDAGLPLVNCLEILGNQTENKRFGKVILNVKETVEGGSNLSDAMHQHPRVFDDLFTNLVAAGESGGILDTILNRQAAYLEKTAKLRRQIKGAMTYPVIVLCVAIGSVAAMMLKVIPTFQQLFKDFGAENELPGPTQFVINLSEGFARWAPFVFGGLILFIVLFVFFYRSPRGKMIVHRFLLLLPIFGPLVRKIAVARFTRTLGTLLSSGVPILDALEITARTAGNVVVEKSIRFARERISEGKTMAEPLAQAKIFPGMVVQMIAVGEQTGALDQMCSKIADFYEDEVDVAIGALTSMIEPLLMVFIGGAVGGMLIAMYLPIFGIAGKIKSQ
ncbi:MAG: type II secretion system F family protein [Deltaproteobacteria bacterium]|nr:type II secretion system F family protein [Deltaproteobacteria bacterium]